MPSERWEDKHDTMVHFVKETCKPKHTATSVDYWLGWEGTRPQICVIWCGGYGQEGGYKQMECLHGVRGRIFREPWEHGIKEDPERLPNCGECFSKVDEWRKNENRKQEERRRQDAKKKKRRMRTERRRMPLPRWWQVATTLVIIIIAAWTAFVNAKPQEPAIPKAGGEYHINQRTGGRNSLNKHSTLEFIFASVVDPSLPVQITEPFGVSVGYIRRETRYTIDLKISQTLKLDEDVLHVQAMTIIFRCYNLYYEYTTSLSLDIVRDLKKDELAVHKINPDAPYVNEVDRVATDWLSSWAEAKKHYISIAYIEKIRTSDGKVHEADKEKIQKISREMIAELTPPSR